MSDISEYLSLVNDTSSNNKILKYVVMILMLILFFMQIFIKIDNYYLLDGYVNDGLIEINVDIKDIDKIIFNNVIYINDRKYKYIIYDVNEDLTPIMDSYYKIIRLKVNIDEDKLEDNSILHLKMKDNSEKLIKIIYKKVRDNI